MDAYTCFAEVYDLFMNDIPYDEWCSYVVSLLADYGIRDGLLLDIGCGTGGMTTRLAAAGYDMTGLDISGEMLSVATEKQAESGHNILYLNQDMRAFELYGTVRAVVSICDSMNYLLDYQDLVQVFRQVNNYLDPGGIFIFDLNTEYKYRELMRDETFAEDREEGSFIWENNYDEETRINSYELVLFIRRENGLYQKYTETHFQKAHHLSEIKEAVAESGMEYLAAYDAFSRNAPTDESERIYVIVREKGKEGGAACQIIS